MFVSIINSELKLFMFHIELGKYVFHVKYLFYAKP